MKELQNDATAILVPENHKDPNGMKFIRANFEWIFELELESWWTNEDDWPIQRDWKTFQDWFDVEFHSEVIDPTELPIRKEEY